MKSCRPPEPPDTSPASPYVNYLWVPVRDTIKLVDLDDIVYFESRDKYTNLHTVSDEFLLDSALTSLECRLAPSQFLRIHRRHIVNVRYIKEFQRWGQRRLKVVMTVRTEHDLMVSRRSVGQVMSKLELRA